MLVLLLATATAFAVAERLKLQRSPVTAPRIDRVVGPTCECEQAQARLGIRLREPHRIDASIVDSVGDPVRVLATDLRRPAGRVRFAWDGRDDDGEVVPDGRYRLRIRLRDEQRAITVPTPIRVDSTPPTIRLLATGRQVISPDGDGRGDRIQYDYRVNERARAFVVVGGEDAARGRLGRPGRGTINWRGRVGGEPAQPTTYATWLVGEDEAGNRSEPTRTVPVRVRYVELARVPRVVSPGALVRVVVGADARQVTLWFEPRGGNRESARARRRPGAVVLRAPRTPGRYTLRVSTARHTDAAPVRVVRR